MLISPVPLSPDLYDPHSGLVAIAFITGEPDNAFCRLERGELTLSQVPLPRLVSISLPLISAVIKRRVNSSLILNSSLVLSSAGEGGTECGQVRGHYLSSWLLSPRPVPEDQSWRQTCARHVQSSQPAQRGRQVDINCFGPPSLPISLPLYLLLSHNTIIIHSLFHLSKASRHVQLLTTGLTMPVTRLTRWIGFSASTLMLYCSPVNSVFANLTPGYTTWPARDLEYSQQRYRLQWVLCVSAV